MVTGSGRPSGISGRVAAISQFSSRRPNTGDRIAPPTTTPTMAVMAVWMDLTTRARNLRRGVTVRSEGLSMFRPGIGTAARSAVATPRNTFDPEAVSYTHLRAHETPEQL